MSRPQVVKQLWVYIREHTLQDPAKKSDIINDDLFKEIFGVERMTMFSMNKVRVMQMQFLLDGILIFLMYQYLSKSVSPVE